MGAIAEGHHNDPQSTWNRYSSTANGVPEATPLPLLRSDYDDLMRFEKDSTLPLSIQPPKALR
jgi:hypothetical protein